jgi:hypothetical protein
LWGNSAASDTYGRSVATIRLHPGTRPRHASSEHRRFIDLSYFLSIVCLLSRTRTPIELRLPKESVCVPIQTRMSFIVPKLFAFKVNFIYEANGFERVEPEVEAFTRSEGRGRARTSKGEQGRSESSWLVIEQFAAHKLIATTNKLVV